jgi:hypothetical protein
MSKSTYYLTPLFARAAYEQIDAWHQEQTGAPVSAQILDTKGLNNGKLEGALNAANVSIDLLVKQNIAEAFNAGWSDRDLSNKSYKINMDMLRNKASLHGFTPV